MRVLHTVVLIGLLAVFSTSSLYGQWNTPSPGNSMSTPNHVAIGDAIPWADISLRLSIPTGTGGTPCAAPPTELYRCFQLAFGTSAAVWWGFKLDGINDLHLIRQSNIGWQEGVTFARNGKVSVNGGIAINGMAGSGIIPVRIDTPNSGGFGVEFRDLDQYTNGVLLDLKGNSTIAVSNLSMGWVGIPLLRSTTSSPLYLNLFSPTSNVVIGSPDPSYNSMGLLVESNGKSTFRGTVGIGTTAPDTAYKLDVVGDARFSGTVSGGNIQAKYQDLAEWVPSATALTAATVVVLDTTRSNHVTPSLHAYDTSVAGVVSARPGIALGEAGESKALIATTGRVHVRVDASRQPIAIGDLLVTSDKPGLAMKSMPIDLQGIALHRPGTVVGKALEPLAGGEGEILVLLSLQ